MISNAGFVVNGVFVINDVLMIGYKKARASLKELGVRHRTWCQAQRDFRISRRIIALCAPKRGVILNIVSDAVNRRLAWPDLGNIQNFAITSRCLARADVVNFKK